MRHKAKHLALLAAALLLTASVTACKQPHENPPDTTPNTTVASTQKKTDPATDAITETTVSPETEPAPAFDVTADGATARVTTPTGLTYTLSGFDSIDPVTAEVTFSGPLTVTLTDDALNGKFNRFTLAYTSDQPLQIALTVGTPEKDIYFLEAGGGEFSAVIPGFLESKYRRKLTAMTVTACTGETAAFSLMSLATEVADVPADSTYYLENARFKLGIALHWGGTISYLEDKACTVDGLGNLVDRHDTGRLIQQSYYGTIGADNDYEPGISFGSTWHYNPVQGGDLYGVGGRIVDFRATENSLYIKSQPCDWAKSGSYTPFYTENTYTLESDHVRVDNRAVDFSGYEHPYHFQELPALYVVSYLNTFTCYNGDAPWTDGALTAYRGLPFWDHGRQIVYFNEQNTETWYCWYSEEDNFGIGAYVPAVDSVGGGRNEPEVRDKSDVGGSTSFGGGACILRMKSYEPLEYSYLLTAGSVESIRATFKENKDFTDNADLDEDCLPQEAPYMPTTAAELASPDLSRAGGNQFAFQNSTAVYDESEGALKIITTSGDAAIHIKYNVLRNNPFHAAEHPDMERISLHTDDYKTFKVVYMIPAANSAATYNSELYPCTGEQLSPEGHTLMWISGLVADGQYHTLEIDLSASPYWNGDIHQIRFDFFNSSAIGDIIYIKSITLE